MVGDKTRAVRDPRRTEMGGYETRAVRDPRRTGFGMCSRQSSILKPHIMPSGNPQLSYHALGQSSILNPNS
jgi:hypothetical protein